MSPRDLLASLLDSQVDPPEELAQVAQLLRVGRAQRLERESDLAQAEYEDLHGEDETQLRALSLEQPEGLRLAAAPLEDDGPRVYRSGAWTLRWGSRADGGSTVMLLGPGPAELLLGDARIPLTPRRWEAVPVPAPPREVSLMLPDGSLILLTR